MALTDQMNNITFSTPARASRDPDRISTATNLGGLFVVPMTKKNQFLDPRWQKKRLEVLERGQWTCSVCGEKDKTLHVHHRYYVSGRAPWEYMPFCYVVQCKDCHVQRYEAEDGTVAWHEWEIFLDEMFKNSPEEHVCDSLDLAYEIHLVRETGLKSEQIGSEILMFLTGLRKERTAKG